MSALVLDLETCALASSLAAEYPESDRNPPANYKAEDKIAAWREADKKKWANERNKECALSPRLGRILCAGYVRTDISAEEAVTVTAMTEESEADLLRELWDAIGLAGGNIITFNGLSFDVPFFLTRSLILGVEPTVSRRTVRDWGKRYSVFPHYDVRAVLTGWESRTSGTLTDWSVCLNCYTPQEVKGADIADLYAAGDFDAIAKHCRDDVTTTKNLYDRVSKLYGECA